MNAQRYVLFAGVIPLSRVFGQFPKMNLYGINRAGIPVYDGQPQPAGIAAFADKRGFRQEPAAQAEDVLYRFPHLLYTKQNGTFKYRFAAAFWHFACFLAWKR